MLSRNSFQRSSAVLAANGLDIHHTSSIHLGYISGLGLGLGPGVFEVGQDIETVVEECLVSFHVCCDEVLVDFDVDVG